MNFLFFFSIFRGYICLNRNNIYFKRIDPNTISIEILFKRGFDKFSVGSYYFFKNKPAVNIDLYWFL